MTCVLRESGIHGKLCTEHPHNEKFGLIVNDEGCIALLGAMARAIPARKKLPAVPELTHEEKIQWAKDLGVA